VLPLDSDPGVGPWAAMPTGQRRNSHLRVLACPHSTVRNGITSTQPSRIEAGDMTKKPKNDDPENVVNFPTSYDAFTCPRGHWVDMDKKGPKLTSTPNAIVALRYLLKDKGIDLQYDDWRQHFITIPPQGKEPIRQWRNEIYQEHKLMFSSEKLEDAKFQISMKYRFHSQKRYYEQLRWDQTPRIETFVKDCLKMDGTPLELCVIKMQLIASVRRVYLPGAAYDLVPCLLSLQGLGKSKMLSILYGEHNVLAEDITTLTSQKQSEKARHGINCVELPDTLGDNTKLNIKKIKAFVTNRFYIGRDPYDRVENMRPIGKSYVIWHTGNDYRFLGDETGNRRFIPMHVNDYIDDKWLRDNRDQLWAEIVELELRSRLEYYAANPGMQKDQEKFPDIFLPQEFWDEAEELQRRHMKPDVALISYETKLKDLIDQPFVIKEATVTWVKVDDIRKYLGVSEERWNGKPNDKGKGFKNLSEEITTILKQFNWEKDQIWRYQTKWRCYKLQK
jgi:Virulence-associated protein E